MVRSLENLDAILDKAVVYVGMVHGDAGYIARHVGEVLVVLVADHVLRHHGERLRNVDQRGALLVATAVLLA
jgi:hypothetical protein